VKTGHHISKAIAASRNLPDDAVEGVLDGYLEDGMDGAMYTLLESLNPKSTASRKVYSSRPTRGREKGYAPWKPQKKTRVILAQVLEILDEYESELPLTARQIFYRLVGAYGYPKSAYEKFSEVRIAEVQHL
jgi:hypothetical protein